MIEPMTKPVTIAIVDDHEIVRTGVEHQLRTCLPQAEVIASVATIGELPGDEPADVIILDLLLHDGESLDAVPGLIERGSKILLYTSEQRPVPLRHAVELGISGIMLKGDPASTIVDGVTMAMDGQFYVSGPLAHALISESGLIADLSEQQRQVLQCIDEGLDYRATARVMNISGNTVKEYLARIRDKYREQGHKPGNSHHLTRLAYEEGHLR